MKSHENILRVKAHSDIAQQELKQFLLSNDGTAETKEPSFLNLSGFSNIVVRQKHDNLICLTFTSESEALLNWLEAVSNKFPHLDFSLEYDAFPEIKFAATCDAYSGNLILYSHIVSWCD